MTTQTPSPGSQWAPELRAMTVRAVGQLRPVVQVHGQRWAEFLSSEDEGAWDAHLLLLGQRLADLARAKSDVQTERSWCTSPGKPGRCGCKGCLFMEELRMAEEGYRDPDRDRGSASPTIWMRLASEHHAKWLNQKEAREHERIEEE
jgi:hypothetical protein